MSIHRRILFVIFSPFGTNDVYYRKKKKNEFCASVDSMFSAFVFPHLSRFALCNLTPLLQKRA